MTDPISSPYVEQIDCGMISLRNNIRICGETEREDDKREDDDEDSTEDDSLYLSAEYIRSNDG